MGYILTLIYIVLYYIRPFEWSSGFREYPILQFIGGAGFIVVLVSRFSRGYRISENLTDLMMFGFMISIGLSHASHLWFGGAWKSMGIFLPSFVGYFIVVHSLDNKAKIEWFITVLIGCSVIIAIIGILQYYTGSPIAGAEALVQREYTSYGNIVGEIRRIRWIGPFADPNDLAIAFVLVTPFLIYRVGKGDYLLPIVSFPLLAIALYLTNSRGGIISVAMAMGTYFVIHRGKFKGAMIALIVVGLIVIFGPSRIGNISATEASSYGRLDAWYAGFQLLKENPMFGSGAGTFTDYHEITAHNSVVLVFAELGIVGTFFFIGIFYGPYEMAISAIRRTATDAEAIDNIKGMISAMMASLTGVVISMFFLSRSYTFLPYMLAGFVVGGLRNFGAVMVMPMDVDKHSLFSRHLIRIISIEIGAIIIINVLLKILL